MSVTIHSELYLVKCRNNPKMKHIFVIKMELLVIITNLYIFGSSVCKDIQDDSNLSGTYYYSEIDNSLNDIMLNVTTQSAIACVFNCRTANGCNSASYNKQINECRLHNNHPYDLNVTVGANGFRIFYEKRLVAECGVGWVVIEDSSYCSNFKELGVDEAQSQCESYGGNLIKIEDSQENEYAKYLAKCARYNSLYGDFRWYDNTSVTYDGWAPEEPDVNGCVDISLNHEFEWNDHAYCYEPLESICEKE